MKLFYHVFLLLFILCSGCSLLTDNSEPEPGSRNYTWTTENINGPPGLVYDVWGTGRKNLWMASTSGFWHYNGDKWKEVEENQEFHCGVFETIFGFSKDDMWVGCNDGRIHHYDGSGWKPSFRYDKEEFHLSAINDIWGRSPDDIYAVGYLTYKDTSGIYSFLLHYDGRRWSEVLTAEFTSQFERVRKDNIVYLSGIKEGIQDGGSTDSLAVYSLGFKGFNQGYIEPRSSTLRMNSIADDIYFIRGKTLFRLDYPAKTEVLSLPESEEVYDVMGRSENDLIITTRDGLLHYNGEDLEYIFDIEYEPFRGYRVLVLEDEIFVFLENREENTWVLQHGILEENE